MVGDSASLTIGHVGQGDQRRAVGNSISLLDGVTHRVDIGIVRLVRLVHGDATARTQIEPGQLGQADVGPDTDGTDHEVGGEDPPVGQNDMTFLDGGDGGARLDVNAMGDQFVAHQNGEFRVEGRQHLRGRLDDRDVNPLPDEVLGHFKPDESGTYHNGARRRRPRRPKQDEPHPRRS